MGCRIVACLLLLALPISAEPLDPLRRRADLRAAIAPPTGRDPARVVRVDEGSALFIAGVRAKDEIVSMNGMPFVDPIDFDRRMAALRGGDEVRFGIRRAGSSKPVAAVLPPLSREQIAGVEVVYTHVKNPRGPRQRAILTRPLGSARRLPAILFVPWLSCDSVESPAPPAPGIDLLLQRIAAQSGMVMLRVDKPGVGDSEGVCVDTDLHTEMDGSRAALAWLREHAWVDPSRIVLMGHSFSGAFLPEIAGSTRVAGYIVLNSWVRSWYERLIEFERLRLEADRMPPADVTTRVLALSQLYTSFLLEKKTPRDVLTSNPALGAVWEDGPAHQYGRSATFHHQLAALNPARAWSAVNVATLAIWSEQDIVMHRHDHERLIALVNANAPGKARLVTAPGDHGMATQAADGRRVLPEAVPAAVLAFLKEVGAGPG
jgi:hypothetical protein